MAASDAAPVWQSERVTQTRRPTMPEPMPSDLWWSPSMRQLLTRHENGNDEHLVWVVETSHRSLRNVLGEANSNPPMPDDAVQLLPVPPSQTCGAWGGCTQPVGHNRGSADIPENHGPFWQGLAEYWEREHQNTVLPYTSKLEEDRDRAEAVARSALHTLKLAAAERDALQKKLDQIRVIAEEAPEPRGALRRRLLAVLNEESQKDDV
jgi:hypothetical protein